MSTDRLKKKKSRYKVKKNTTPRNKTEQAKVLRRCDK